MLNPTNHISQSYLSMSRKLPDDSSSSRVHKRIPSLSCLHSCFLITQVRSSVAATQRCPVRIARWATKARNPPPRRESLPAEVRHLSGRAVWLRPQGSGPLLKLQTPLYRSAADDVNLTALFCTHDRWVARKEVRRARSCFGVFERRAQEVAKCVMHVFT